MSRRGAPLVVASLPGVVLAIAVVAPQGCAPRPAARCGLDGLVDSKFSALAGKRVALVTNQTGVDRRLRHVADLLDTVGNVELVALFGPEHGVRGIARAGERVEDSVDPRTRVPVYSLYGASRKPRPEQLEGVDAIVYDIQDIGVRTYTYLSTLELCMEAAAEAGVEIWVLDRPNPLGRAVGGPVLEPAFESFVGPHPMPMRYGMTVGEFARMVRAERQIDVRLEVVPCGGAVSPAAIGGAPWIAPSPNIPTRLTALLYAGLVLIEGTNLSEGRGTTRPFQLVGAPWLDASAAAAALEGLALPGVRFRPTGFVPTFSKYEGEACAAIEVHVTDEATYRPEMTAVAVIVAARRLHADRFRFREKAFDRLAGTDRLRLAIEAGRSADEIARSWEDALADFELRRQPFLLYP